MCFILNLYNQLLITNSKAAHIYVYATAQKQSSQQTLELWNITLWICFTFQLLTYHYCKMRPRRNLIVGTSSVLNSFSLLRQTSWKRSNSETHEYLSDRPCGRWFASALPCMEQTMECVSEAVRQGTVWRQSALNISTCLCLVYRYARARYFIWTSQKQEVP